MHSSWYPGGVPWVFWQILLRGGTWGCEKISGGVIFNAFLCGSFQKYIYRGYMRCPPSPCVYLWWSITLHSRASKLYFLLLVITQKWLYYLNYPYSSFMNKLNTFPLSGLLPVHKTWFRSLLWKDQPKNQKNSKQNWNVMWFKGPIN